MVREQCNMDSRHAVKHEPIALQLLEQTLELGLQPRFTHLEDANRLITASKSRLNSSQIFKTHLHWNSEMRFFLGYR